MNEANSHTPLTQQLLQRALTGDEDALNALLRHSSERLAYLTRHMLAKFVRVRRWAETDDVLQNALMRLVGALQQVKPASPREFLGLAALQIRRELLDLARHYYGPQGVGANHQTPSPEGQRVQDLAPGTVGEDDPALLMQWTELHRQIGVLPEEEREIIDLLFYQGLTQPEAAEILGLSLRTLQRRWHTALCKLHRFWTGH